MGGGVQPPERLAAGALHEAVYEQVFMCDECNILLGKRKTFRVN
jgi:hypothetical protein